MDNFYKMLSKQNSKSERRVRPAPIFQLVPGQSLSTGYFLLQVEPAIRHGIEELAETNPRHALTELALIAYLMGMGFDYPTAIVIVESWERDDTLLAQGILTE
ncbi:hypothetical protein [Sporomusa acidovorans]|uniref:Uncharacterized protein n=1 Tax=Sporomusa acidovorans (strain ATCC 49682 / DSM 3132 / Mol) TaxID=1123286 RepID=A0ABZ3J8B8_SPOA4|nr:hypothetical protein [Sporomusa acidovorans]OZC21211.1 hypothetical protein SPACI_20630 [Sporomusa acidovorans DSM 3132]SDE64855.1 hypothetical protein SAMN04488499_101828 [Sporomusa acidovorans]